LLVLGAFAVAAAGQSEERPRIEVPYSASLPPLDEGTPGAAWAGAAKIEGFRPPLGMAVSPETELTEVRLLWTKEALLVRFDCGDRAIVRLLESGVPATRRDLSYYAADCVELFLDGVGDGKAFVEIQISPDNGVFDALHLCTGVRESGKFCAEGDDDSSRDVVFPGMEFRRTQDGGADPQRTGWLERDAGGACRADFEAAGEEGVRRGDDVAGQLRAAGLCAGKRKAGGDYELGPGGRGAGSSFSCRDGVFNSACP